MCAAAHGGQVLLSQTTRDLVAGDLPQGTSLRDLGEHRIKDLGLPQRLYQILATGLPAEFPPLRSVDILPNNLPVQLTSFIGRAYEIAEVKRLLSRTRLLTLTGAGGSGKTRLAIHVAADLLERYPDGIWWVELASLVDPNDVPGAVASALKALEQPGRPIGETLADSLSTKDLLLVLDNCEHLVSACAGLADALLRACPKLRVVATSREALGLAGELTYRVPSLSLPDIQRLPAAPQLLDFEAIRLFAERATFSDPRFEITSNSAAAVAQICVRLDGIPLAIELAAARVKVLAVEQIAERLNDRFRLLTAGSRAAIPRHQTLRATLDWSYALLSERERLLLNRLSVFAGGCTLETAEAVCAGSDVEGSEILDLLTQLAEKSLILVEVRGGEARYRLLETVREYCCSRLRESHEESAVRARHTDFFLAMAERWEPGLYGPREVMWLERLEAEHDNLRTALDWAVDAAPEMALRLAGVVWRFWDTRGFFSEGRARLQRVLAAAQQATRARINALDGAGVLAFRQGDLVAARTLHEEALALSRDLGDRGAIARSLDHLSWIVASQGENEKARGFLEESLALARQSNDQLRICHVLLILGEHARGEGDYDRACKMIEESLPLARRLGSKTTTSTLLVNYGHVMLHHGNIRRAAALFAESLTVARDAGVRRIFRMQLVGVAGVALAAGQAVRASRLVGAAEALGEAMGASVEFGDREDYDRITAAVRAALDEGAYQAACAEGGKMTQEQAIESALKEVD
jgi:predicted ATPase